MGSAARSALRSSAPDHAALDEPEAARARAHGHVEAERMDVEQAPAGTKGRLEVTQDVHDVLRLHSSE